MVILIKWSIPNQEPLNKETERLVPVANWFFFFFSSLSLSHYLTAALYHISVSIHLCSLCYTLSPRVWILWGSNLSHLSLKAWFYPAAALHQLFVVTWSGEGCVCVYVCVHKWVYTCCNSVVGLIAMHQDLKARVFLCECICTVPQRMISHERSDLKMEKKKI